MASLGGGGCGSGCGPLAAVAAENGFKGMVRRPRLPGRRGSSHIAWLYSSPLPCCVARACSAADKQPMVADGGLAPRVVEAGRDESGRVERGKA